MPKFRKRPIIISAEQYRPFSAPIPGVCHCDARQEGAHLHTIHAGQVVELEEGDWVIPESDGMHFYPCKPDVFERTYEPVEDGP